jgi:hypothetical protein
MPPRFVCAVSAVADKAKIATRLSFIDSRVSWDAIVLGNLEPEKGEFVLTKFSYEPRNAGMRPIEMGRLF